ncbi:MAG: hypothetical protein V4489_09095 [Chlamydiota bacterium]
MNNFGISSGMHRGVFSVNIELPSLFNHVKIDNPGVKKVVMLILDEEL